MEGDLTIQRHRRPFNSTRTWWTFFLLCVAFITFGYLLVTQQSIQILHPPNPSAVTSRLPQPVYFITITDEGRFGNMFFKFVTLITVANTSSLIPMISNKMSQTLEKLFDVKWVRKLPNNVDTRPWKQYQEKSPYIYSDDINNLTKGSSWRLKGYFQCWKYFYKNNKYLRERMQIHNDLRKKAEEFLHQRTNLTGCICVGIHVRRGDYLEKLYINHGYVMPDPEYYTKAIKYYKDRFKGKEIVFVVISDDITWCKHNINGSDVYFSDMNSIEGDLALMSLCNHTITSIGSFGWLVAWLANGVNVYFAGYSRAGSDLEKRFNKDDVFPPNWIGIKY